MSKQPVEQYPVANSDAIVEEDEESGLSPSTSSEVGSHTRSTNSYERRLEHDLQTGGAWGVQTSKLGVYGVLFLAAVATALATFFIVQNSEEDLRVAEFHRYGKHITDTVQARVQNAYSLARDLSVSITAGAMDSSAVWPNVTLSNFDKRTEEFFARTGADFIVFAPRVRRQVADAWQEYVYEQPAKFTVGIAASGRQHEIHAAINGTVHDKPHYAPVWQQSPPSRHQLQDLNSLGWFRQMSTQAADLHEAVFSSIVNVDFLMDGLDDKTDEEEQQTKTLSSRDPHSTVLSVVYRSFDEEETEKTISGYVLFSLLWTNIFANLLPPGVGGLVVTIHDGCGTEVSYQLRGPQATFWDWTDLHDRSYTHHNDSYSFNTMMDSNFTTTATTCPYRIAVYPTQDRIEGTNRQPLIYAMAIFLLFTLASFIFFFYDFVMLRRQRFLEHRARQTTAIVSSLFPETVHRRLLDEMDEREQANNGGSKVRYLRDLVRDRMDRDADSDGVFDTPPIAELFPACTVMFADIAGFTAWSSTREPPQVFVLLETLYHEIDVIAQRRRVFKVETIGDCYVAVAGLPTARVDHAIVMCRFARDCLEKTNTVTKTLEERLGPDTGDLCMRIGLHSGPVTAGVLRGEKARFQLFGDTVNTTARIESLGARNRIHVSEDTAKCIIEAGKEHWVCEREHQVSAKGKGKLKTYWVDTRQKSNSVASGQENRMSEIIELPRKGQLVSSRPGIHVEDLGSVASSTASFTDESDFMASMLTEKEERLAKWNVDVLTKLMRRIVARRQAAGSPKDPEYRLKELEQSSLDRAKAFEEVQEVITLPQFDPMIARREVKPESIELGKEVVKQLHKYIVTIAAMYHPNAFHNFEHVSHVTMSVTKLLSRIVAPDLGRKNEDSTGKTLHDHTYGITSDPLTQFAVVFSALIHDVDHQGVSNAQLIKEGATIAGAYDNRSVAEQNSLDISWALLMDESFYDLRRVLYTTTDEFRRLRQLVVNAVMATDIMDKELSAARKARWEKAFSTDVGSERYHVNRKATIVIEHLIQASDVSHTMQHWHVYRKWNVRLFEEMRRAYKEGRMEKDPAEGWYEGEKGFFDFYIIPLAKKLKDCGVFGVSSDEYLNYAIKNREEWEVKGQEIVEEMVQKCPLE